MKNVLSRMLPVTPLTAEDLGILIRNFDDYWGGLVTDLSDIRRSAVISLAKAKYGLNKIRARITTDFCGKIF